jgi:hypothetical protein
MREILKFTVFTGAKLQDKNRTTPANRKFKAITPPVSHAPFARRQINQYFRPRQPPDNTQQIARATTRVII